MIFGDTEVQQYAAMYNYNSNIKLENNGIINRKKIIDDEH
jgi:hypothetical protein